MYGPSTVQLALKPPLPSTVALTGNVRDPAPLLAVVSVSVTGEPAAAPAKLTPCMVSDWLIWTDDVDRRRAGGDEVSTTYVAVELVIPLAQI